MSGLDAALLGALAGAGLLLAAGGAVWVLAKAHGLLSGLRASLEAAGKSFAVLAAKADRAAAAAETVARELAFMRTMAERQVQEQGGTIPPQPRQAAPFPGIDWDKVRDAELGDTDMGLLRQTDEDLAELDRLERLRQAGVDVRPEEGQPEGFTMESA